MQQNLTVKSDFAKLIKDFVKIPQIGELVRGAVFSVSKNEVRVNIYNFKSGVIRGPELYDLKSLYPDLKEGDEIEATVIDLENENGEVELSLRFTGERLGWDEVEKAKRENKIIEIKILEANTGGLLGVTDRRLSGFLPVSQLSPEHYPRVPGGEKGKILEKLREFIGTKLGVKILDYDPRDKKLIFSEKIVWEEEQKGLLSKYKPGDIIEGKVTALADFGAFVVFPADVEDSGKETLEGLIHISEIAWQRLDHPSDVFKIGDKIKAKIIDIEGSKIFLSLRALAADPWKNIAERYQVGQTVRGKVLKVNPFGLFVELDTEIHGLAHISELNIKPEIKLEDQIKPNDVLEFRILSIEPESHRLGLSQKIPQDKGESSKESSPNVDS